MTMVLRYRVCTMTALTRKAFEAYRQWFDQWVRTRDPRMLRTAVICQIIVREQLARDRADQNWRRFEWDRGRSRRGASHGGDGRAEASG
jgi:hypothetical protein